MLGELKRLQEQATVMVVDDEAMNREVIKACLSVSYNVITAKNGKEAVELAKARRPDLILLDIIMDEMDGWTTCSIIKSSSDIAHIPVIFATSRDDDDTQIRCWEAGCVDFITKPINFSTLSHRVRTHIAHKLKTELLENLAKYDVLTKLYCRRALEEDYPVVAGHCLRNRNPISILIADIDDFKLYNDTYGHLPGDEVLLKVASLLKDALHRITDRFYRFGGEEFVALLPNTDCNGANIMAHRLNQVLRTEKIVHRGSELGFVTISIGGICFEHSQIPKSSSDAFSMADKALYQAKSSGKNRHIVKKYDPYCFGTLTSGKL
ncbi:diguanylate cyclase [Vibrio vulnificus]|uniref:diguanylate cyclase n=1 Tax=Vibrio vulnificus TaxID=672 RepID=UPI001302326A|nr:diguanylate cyclase [Vibrio vulnificus]MCU8490905.1 diguanylate cyclase [Vibrio vulnificus]MCU8506534.1 diguanylate cyclase [Vibrio vulnificus]